MYSKDCHTSFQQFIHVGMDQLCVSSITLHSAFASISLVCNLVIRLTIFKNFALAIVQFLFMI